MRVSVKAEIAQRKAEGNFFRKDPVKTMMGNALDAVEWLANEGAKAMRAGLPAGFTRDNIEVMTYRRDQMVTGRSVQSRFAKSRLRPGLTRDPASAEWPAARRPYVTARVYESGVWGGRVRRTAHKPFSKAYRRMKAYERTIRRDLTEGLT